MKELVIEIPGLVPEPVTVALKADLTISEDLEREVKCTPSQFGYYAVLSEKAESRYRRCKLGFDLWRSEAEDDLEAQQRVETGKGFSKVKDLTRLIMRQPKYRAYMLKLDEYEEHARILKKVAEAFAHKKDLVQTICSNRRSEMKGGS